MCKLNTYNASQIENIQFIKQSEDKDWYNCVIKAFQLLSHLNFVSLQVTTHIYTILMAENHMK